jgi:carbohydrate kinase (thermoresistant glucokinase family)
MIIVVMGVAGSGKSTVGTLLSQRLSLPFIEADDFHTKDNVAKMSHGIPLTDEDRYPWLKLLSNKLRLHEQKNGAVLACSALKEDYRKRLQEGLHEKIIWIYLEGTEQLIKERMKKRHGHFMPDTLLESQLATLEKPSNAYCFSIEKTPGEIVNDIMRTILK